MKLNNKQPEQDPLDPARNIFRQAAARNRKSRTIESAPGTSGNCQKREVEKVGGQKFKKPIIVEFPDGVTKEYSNEHPSGKVLIR